jgi:anti-sigma factor RsiW
MMVGQISASSVIRSSCSAVSWVPSAVSASPVLACSSGRVMVTITAAGTPPTVGWSSAFNNPGAGFFECIVEPLHMGAFIRNLDDVAVFVFNAAGSWCGEWVHDGVQLGTDGVAEPAVQLPHAVPPLVEFEMAPVVL